MQQPRTILTSSIDWIYILLHVIIDMNYSLKICKNTVTVFNLKLKICFTQKKSQKIQKKL